MLYENSKSIILFKFDYRLVYDVCEGSTPLIKLSIEIHTNIVLRDCNSTPHVTIFWKFVDKKCLNKGLTFI